MPIGFHGAGQWVTPPFSWYCAGRHSIDVPSEGYLCGVQVSLLLLPVITWSRTKFKTSEKTEVQLKFNWLDATHLKSVPLLFFILFLNNKMWWTFPGFGSLSKNYTWFKFDQSLSLSVFSSHVCLTGTTGLFRLVLTNPVLPPCFYLWWIIQCQNWFPFKRNWDEV